MGMDRFIKWGEPPEWGSPTLATVAQVLQDFLGPRWKVRATDMTWLVAECDDVQTFALRSEYSDSKHVTPTFLDGWDATHGEITRGFEVSFPSKESGRPTSVITRSADQYTRALADEFTKIIARWWNGEVDWPS
jgi:hypothetical protein